MSAPLPLVAALREERRRQGLTQAEVAVRAGYHPTTFAPYELGRCSPSVYALTRWATALGLKVALYPPVEPSQPPPSPELPPEVAELMRELIHTLAQLFEEDDD